MSAREKPLYAGGCAILFLFAKLHPLDCHGHPRRSLAPTLAGGLAAASVESLFVAHRSVSAGLVQRGLLDFC